MFGAFERAVAGRYLRARRGERFVSVIAIFSLIGIALGVATLIIVMSVMNGFKSDLLGRILGLNGDLSIYSGGATLTDYDALAGRVRAVPGVIDAVPLVEGQVLLSTDRGSSGGLVRGMRAADLRNLHEISDNIRAGSLDGFGAGTVPPAPATAPAAGAPLSFPPSSAPPPSPPPGSAAATTPGPAAANEDGIAIGLTLAQRFGLAVGSKLTLVSPDGAATAFGTVPRVRAYRVVAIFQAGLNDYDSTFVFLPLAASQVFFQKPGQATQISVKVRDPERVAPVTRAIRASLDAQPPPGGPVRVVDWTQSNNSFFAAIQVEQNVMFLILTLIILVAAFNVVSSLIMMVKDKTRDIAVLRTLGARRGAIMRIFLMCGASVGVTGTLLGTALGVVFCANIERIRLALQSVTGTDLFSPEVYYLEHLPAKLDWREVSQVILMALVLSLLATLYPSWRAARTDPVEALRHE